MPSRTKPSRIQTKNRALILEAALKEFSQNGFAGTTVERIALEASMSKSNLLYYFSSKDDIYDATLDHILEIWLAPLRTLDPEGDPAIELAGYIRQKIEMSAQYPEASKLFAKEVMRGAPHILGLLETELKKLIDDKCLILQRWMDDEKLARMEPIHLIFSIWAITQHYADFSAQVKALSGKDLYDRAFLEETVRAVSTLILNGIGLSYSDI